MSAKFVVTRGADDKYRFALKASNGQTILTSEAYNGKAGAMKGIESVRKNSMLEDRFVRLEGKDGSPYFVLKAGNAQQIGVSEMYSSSAAMEKGIASVKANAPGAVVDDHTLVAV